MSLLQRKKPCVLLVAMIILLTMTSRLMRADTGTCNGQSVTLPFTDVQGNPFFCAIASAFFSGLTNGTSATTYSPSATVSREQMAAFVSRTLDQSLRRGSRRAARQRFWDSRKKMGLINDASGCFRLLASDGQDVWMADPCDDEVLRVRASDGKVLQTWTNAAQAFGVVVLNGEIFITGKTTPGRLYRINALGDPGNVILVSSNLGGAPEGIAYDGSHLWTANESGSVTRIDAIVTPIVDTFTSGFGSPQGILFDGANIWVTDKGDHTLKKLDSDGNILTSIPVGQSPHYPVFDGMNIWAPNTDSNSITVVRTKDAAGNPLTNPFVLATLTNNSLNQPLAAAFDGERVCITNNANVTVTLWRATDLAFLGRFGDVGPKFGVCSDGVKFWSGSPTVQAISFF
jgi:hypothetical protein